MLKITTEKKKEKKKERGACEKKDPDINIMWLHNVVT